MSDDSSEATGESPAQAEEQADENDDVNMHNDNKNDDKNDDDKGGTKDDDEEYDVNTNEESDEDENFPVVNEEDGKEEDGNEQETSIHPSSSLQEEIRKCANKRCKVINTQEPLLPCVGTKCFKSYHMSCFKHKYQKHHFCDPLSKNGLICCTQKCYKKYDALQNKKPGWDCDGKDGRKDGNSSMKILLKWLTVPGNYAMRWRGKETGGKSKAKIAKEIADEINASGVRFRRTPQQVTSKIQYIEAAFKKAHDFSHTETGAGLQEHDIGSFNDHLEKICPHYFDLLEFFGDRASAKPKALSNENLESSESEDEQSEEGKSENSSVYVPSEEDQSLDDDDGDQELDEESSRNSLQKTRKKMKTPTSQERKRKAVPDISTTSTKNSRSSKSSRKGVVINLMNNDAQSALDTLASSKNRLTLEQIKKLRRDEVAASMEYMKVKRANKLELIAQCEKFVQSHPGWSREKIVRLVPDFESVIDDIMEE